MNKWWRLCPQATCPLVCLEGYSVPVFAVFKATPQAAKRPLSRYLRRPLDIYDTNGIMRRPLYIVCVKCRPQAAKLPRVIL